MLKNVQNKRVLLKSRDVQHPSKSTNPKKLFLLIRYQHCLDGSTQTNLFPSNSKALLRMIFAMLVRATFLQAVLITTHLSSWMTWVSVIPRNSKSINKASKLRNGKSRTSQMTTLIYQMMFYRRSRVRPRRATQARVTSTMIAKIQQINDLPLAVAKIVTLVIPYLQKKTTHQIVTMNQTQKAVRKTKEEIATCFCLDRGISNTHHRSNAVDIKA